jgi:5-methylcytosine-specific restriction endonuclease McrA
LLERPAQDGERVSLEELAEPFSRHVAEHIKLADKQGTSARSRFLDACRRFNRGEITKEQLIDETVRRGFANVIDAFHVVNNREIERRFFLDERSGDKPGIRLTEDFMRLREQFQFRNFPQEVEARWRLVETAWELSLPRAALTLAYDDETRLLVPVKTLQRRRGITSARDALNGYQKGSCFYCFRGVSIRSGAGDLAEVDHFLPHSLKPLRPHLPVDGLWNLVLACQDCNSAKLARVPGLTYLERLNTRNEFFISSHHRLRETIMVQTGATVEGRRSYLQGVYDEAKASLIHTWSPSTEAAPTF